MLKGDVELQLTNCGFALFVQWSTKYKWQWWFLFNGFSLLVGWR